MEAQPTRLRVCSQLTIEVALETAKVRLMASDVFIHGKGKDRVRRFLNQRVELISEAIYCATATLTTAFSDETH